MARNLPLDPPTLGLEQLSLFRESNRWVKKWGVASETSDGVVYVMAVDTFGSYGCSCPSWVHDSKRRECKRIKKHLRDLTEAATNWATTG